MNKHRSEGETEAEGEAASPPPTPRPSVMFFAAAFVIVMTFNLYRGGSDSVTIFLGTGALLTLGVDVGKMIGRR